MEDHPAEKSAGQNIYSNASPDSHILLFPTSFRQYLHIESQFPDFVYKK